MISIANFRIKVGRNIAAPRDLVWQCITDTEKWCEWGPTVSAVQCEERYIEENSTGKVQTVFGFWLPFEVVSFAKKSYWKWRVGGIEATGHNLEELRGSGVRLTFDMPFWAFAYVTVCYLALRRIDAICCAE